MKSFLNIVLYAALFCLVVALRLYPAQATEIASGTNDTRIVQLEFKVNTLQSQLRQLQSQLSQAGVTLSAPAVAEIPSVEIPATFGESPTDLSFEERFDNLATLVIEMNQRLMEIKRRLAQ